MIQLPSPEQRLENPLFEDAGVELWIKRDDLIHPEISGNKWRKLAPILDEVQNRGINKLISYGGAWSNHLLALAAAAHHLGMESMGIVRGEPVNNLVLSRCAELGMKFRFLPREEYRKLRKVDDELRWEGDTCMIPEGANCREGRAGMATLWKELQNEYSYLMDSVGSGTSSKGLHETAPPNTLVLAVMAVNDQNLAEHLRQAGICVFSEYTRGGFAKMDPELLEICERFHHQTGIRLDPVYTAKQWIGAVDLLKKGFFKKGDKVLFVHSGGLAGWLSRDDRIK